MPSIIVNREVKAKLDKALLNEIKSKLNKIKDFDLDKKYYFSYSDFIEGLLNKS